MPARPTGHGIVIALNPSAGGGADGGGDGVDPLHAELAEALPDARLLSLDDPADLVSALERAAEEGATAIGVAGGDGSVSAAAAVAADLGVPLVVIPAGTLNHLARDLGINTLDDAVEAIRAGSVVEADVARVGEATFVNTLSIGCYPEIVDLREQLEGRIGKWPAAIVAAVRVLARAEPISLEIDGRPRRLWSLFVGNCRYAPSSRSLTSRPRLDDGTLDVRMLPADVPGAKLRAMASAMARRLDRSPVIEAWSTTSLVVRCADGEAGERMRIARDGETFDAPKVLDITKDGRRAAVFAPWPARRGGAKRGRFERQLTRGSERSVSIS